jgi:hypothetical protein
MADSKPGDLVAARVQDVEQISVDGQLMGWSPPDDSTFQAPKPVPPGVE